MNIIHKKDNSFIINKDGLPYHIIEGMLEHNELLEKYNTDKTTFSEEVEEPEYVPTYQENRASAYPPLMDFIDACVKLKSDNPEVVSEGELQLNKYVAKCLEVKKMFPK